jgi:hypothetical protein
MAKQAAGLSNFLARPGGARAALAEQRDAVTIPAPVESRALVGASAEARQTLQAPAVPSTKGQGIRALTLRVDNELYNRLRRYAFDQELTHQEVLEAALRGYLEAQSA